MELGQDQLLVSSRWKGGNNEIPLSTNDTNDRLIWAENRSGKFTVKNAYVLVLEEQQHTTMGDCSNGLVCKKTWKAIWHLNVPQKIKHFAWRAGQDILATKSNLAKRKIAPSGICELCGKEEEIVSHLLWFCDTFWALHTMIMILPSTFSALKTEHQGASEPVF